MALSMKCATCFGHMWYNVYDALYLLIKCNYEFDMKFYNQLIIVYFTNEMKLILKRKYIITIL
jgi:hypothetical protein